MDVILTCDNLTPLVHLTNDIQSFIILYIWNKKLEYDTLYCDIILVSQ